MNGLPSLRQFVATSSGGDAAAAPTTGGVGDDAIGAQAKQAAARMMAATTRVRRIIKILPRQGGGSSPYRGFARARRNRCASLCDFPLLLMIFLQKCRRAAANHSPV